MEPYHLAQFGIKGQLPVWLWRRSRRLHNAVTRVRDIWAILRGRATLHRAWQAGHDHGRAMEYKRTKALGFRT